VKVKKNYFTQKVPVLSNEEIPNLNEIDDESEGGRELKKEYTPFFSQRFKDFVSKVTKLITFLGIILFGMYNSKKQNVYWNLNSNFWRKYFINSFEWKKFAYVGALPAFSFWFGISYLFSTKTKQLSLPVIVVQNKEEKKIEIEELKNSLARSNFNHSIHKFKLLLF
jgi:hypothetical protein